MAWNPKGLVGDNIRESEAYNMAVFLSYVQAEGVLEVGFLSTDNGSQTVLTFSCHLLQGPSLSPA